jgi:hypothetical protein
MDVFIEILDNCIKDRILHVIHSVLPMDYYIPLIDHTFSQKWVFVGDETYRNGKYHSFDDKPAKVTKYGRAWYQYDELHRDNDLPALIYYDGSQEWYQHGKIIRYNGPAIIERDTILWWSCDGTSLSEKEYWIEIMNKY